MNYSLQGMVPSDESKSWCQRYGIKPNALFIAVAIFNSCEREASACKRVLVDKARPRRYTERMRSFRLRLLLAIVLVVVGATVFVGMSLEDNAESLVQSQRPASHLDRRGEVLVRKPAASNLHSSRAASETVSRLIRVSLDLVPILRC